MEDIYIFPVNITGVLVYSWFERTLFLPGIVSVFVCSCVISYHIQTVFYFYATPFTFVHRWLNGLRNITALRNNSKLRYARREQYITSYN